MNLGNPISHSSQTNSPLPGPGMLTSFRVMLIPRLWSPTRCDKWIFLRSLLWTNTGKPRGNGLFYRFAIQAYKSLIYRHWTKMRRASVKRLFDILYMYKAWIFPPSTGINSSLLTFRGLMWEFVCEGKKSEALSKRSRGRGKFFWLSGLSWS